MSYQFSNNASSVLTAQLLAAGTTANITPADASKFPVPSGAAVFMATLQKGTGEFEIVRCTANPLTGAMTIVRAQEGTAAQQFEIGDFFSHRLTAGALNVFPQSDGTLQTNLNAQRVNGIEAATTAQANKLLALNGSGLLPTGITGNAATATNASNLGGNDSAYHLNRANHTGVLQTMQVFTASGTYNKPTGPAPKVLKVTVIGKGGANGNSNGAYPGGGGGGGGAAIKLIDGSAITTETVTVNAATNSFGAHCSATAGADGTSGNSSTPSVGLGGVGGTGAGGDINIPGFAGRNGEEAGAGGGLQTGDPGHSILGTIGSPGDPGIVIVEEFY